MRSPASWCAAIAATLAVHGVMFWAAFTAPPDVAPPWAEPPAVDLVAIQGGETAADKGDVKPAPTPEDPIPRAPPAPPSPVAEGKPVLPAPLVMPMTAAPAQSTAAPAEPAIAHTQGGAAAQVQAAAKAPAAQPAPPLRAGDAAGLNADAPRGKSQDYAAMLRTWLEAHKTYPKHAKIRREEGVVHVRFAVDRQGHLLDGAIVRSSGVASLDREALAMLDRSNPFPAAPHAVRGERIELRTPVEFYLR